MILVCQVTPISKVQPAMSQGWKGGNSTQKYSMRMLWCLWKFVWHCGILLVVFSCSFAGRVTALTVNSNALLVECVSSMALWGFMQDSSWKTFLTTVFFLVFHLHCGMVVFSVLLWLARQWKKWAFDTGFHARFEDTDNKLSGTQVMWHKQELFVMQTGNQWRGCGCDVVWCGG